VKDGSTIGVEVCCRRDEKQMLRLIDGCTSIEPQQAVVLVGPARPIDIAGKPMLSWVWCDI